MQSLYQDQLLALARQVRKNSAHPLPAPTCSAEVNNPICGDRIRASLTTRNNVITVAYAEAKGCALCEAGAGLWLNSVMGQTLSSLPGLHTALADWLAGQDESDSLDLLFSGGLTAFQPVRSIKNRHKCVTLAFATADKFTPV